MSIRHGNNIFQVGFVTLETILEPWSRWLCNIDLKDVCLKELTRKPHLEEIILRILLSDEYSSRRRYS